MTVIDAPLTGQGMRVGIVVARFNEVVTQRLLEGALGTLTKLGVDAADVDVLWVPGAFEIPLAAQKLADTGRYDGLITLGAVIKGSTAHFDYVCQHVTSGVGRVQLDTKLPVLFGVLTTDTVDQAIDRAGAKAGNKGSECATGVVEMVSAFRELDHLTTPGEN